MNKTLILIVEDDTPIRNLISTTLKTHDYKYISCATGEQAIKETSSMNPDIILLDLGLPDMDGMDVIEKIRSWSNVPIIILSARHEDSDKIKALDAGADDYLTKPFSTEELLARLRVTERRINQYQNMHSNASIYTNGPLTIDFAAQTAKINNDTLHLTPLEFKILVLLAKNTGKVLTYTYITQHVWGTNYESDSASLRVFMVSLRKKLESNSNFSFIQTHIGVGYRMLKIDN